jgi:hypothetical protein
MQSAIFFGRNKVFQKIAKVFVLKHAKGQKLAPSSRHFWVVLISWQGEVM